MGLYAKAITAVIMSTLAPLGIDSLTSFEDGVTILVSAAITGVAVYFVPNKG